MPSPTIVNVLALGFVGLVTAGLYLFATYYAPEEETPHQSSRTRRRRSPPPEGWGNAKDQKCFCNNEDYGKENCILRTCAHRFHRRCISQWSETDMNNTRSIKARCPFCREEFDLRMDLEFC